MPARGPRKYDPLATYLAGVAADEVTLTFAAIEAIVGAPLPASARFSAFWPRTAQSLVARPWVRAGWRVLRTDLSSATPTVTFARVH